MEYFRNSDGFVVFFTNEGRVSHRFFNTVTRIDIEPITIDFSVSEFNLLANGWIRSFDIISTERVGWFVVLFPRFEEER